MQQITEEQCNALRYVLRCQIELLDAVETAEALLEGGVDLCDKFADLSHRLRDSNAPVATATAEDLIEAFEIHHYVEE